MHSILNFVLCTNEPDVAKTHIMKSINYLKEVAPISTFLINFQEPWRVKEIGEFLDILTNYGFKVIYKYNHYEVKEKGLVPINKIRNDTAMLGLKLTDGSYPKFWALCDDDMTFRGPTNNMRKSAGQQYIDVVHYMTFHQNCGLVMMGGTLIKNPPKYTIAPTSLANSYLTNRGYVLKVMPEESGLFLPNEAIDLLGSDEDRVLAAYRLHNGLYPAKMSNSRTSHYDNTCIPGYKMYEWNSKEILLANNHGFIKNHYKSDFDGSEYNTDVVDHDHYYEVGGLDVTDSQIVSENSINYENKSTEDTLNEIIKYYESEV